jgi:hypothetical protein
MQATGFLLLLHLQRGRFFDLMGLAVINAPLCQRTHAIHTLRLSQHCLQLLDGA